MYRIERVRERWRLSPVWGKIESSDATRRRNQRTSRFHLFVAETSGFSPQRIGGDFDAREMAQGRRLGRGHLKCLSLPEALDALDEKDSVAEIDSQVQAIDADNFHTILGVCPLRHRRTV